MKTKTLLLNTFLFVILFVFLIFMSSLKCASTMHKPVDNVVDFDIMVKTVNANKDLSESDRAVLKSEIISAQKQDAQKTEYISNLENKVEKVQETNEKKNEKLIDISRKAGEADKSDKTSIMIYIGMGFIALIGVLLILWKFGNIFTPQKAVSSTAETIIHGLINKQ